MIRGIQRSGRVVVSGIGKAGYIGQKLSATLSSLGIASYFLHPTEAMHGDLGRYSKEDVALFLSNSGETAELLTMLPHAKRLGVTVISITGTMESTLAKQSDIVVAYGAVSEAGLLSLAPTTSATLMLVLGDALAMAVLAERGITPEQFATFHPAGSLGFKLKLVSEIMRTSNQLCIVKESMLAKEVLLKISETEGRPGATAIVNSTGTLTGVFTDGDLRRFLSRGTDFLNEPISRVMGKTPKTIEPNKLVSEALGIMTSCKIDQLIVVSPELLPIGMIDIQDIAA